MTESDEVTVRATDTSDTEHLPDRLLSASTSPSGDRREGVLNDLCP